MKDTSLLPATEGYYKQQMSQVNGLGVDITDATVKNFIACCTYFETKDKNSLALNTPMLGVTPIYFTHADVQMLYSVVGVEPKDIAIITSESPHTESNWVIANDPYNNLIVYLVHKTLTAPNVSQSRKQEGCMALLKLLHYKYFTSLVGNSYAYGADEDVMAYVVNNINKKFGLAKLESWKRVIEERCLYLLSSESKHLETFLKYDDDKGVVYVLSDTQSNLRQKIVRINVLYYEAKKNQESISTYSTLDTVDGTKIISSTAEVFDTMITGISQQVMSPSRLLDMELISVISSKYKEVSDELLRMLLNHVCDLAATQKETKTKSVVHVTNKSTGEKEEVIADVVKLVEFFLQKTYRYCINSGDVNMYSKKAILIKVLNIYTSSQMSDEDILKVKRSFMYLVTNSNLSKRQATIAALSFCLLLYLLVRSFEYI